MDEDLDKFLASEKMLFSQRYPRPLRLLDEVAEWEKRAAPPREPPPPPYNGRGLHFMPISGKEGGDFIHMAKEISRMYELDMDLFQDPSALIATFFLRDICYPSSVTTSLGTLMRASDAFTLDTPSGRPNVVKLSLLYHTHEICKDGEWLPPIDQ